MPNKKWLLIGIFAIVLISVPIIFVAYERTREREQIAAILARCEQISEGEGIPEAAEYNPSTPGPHLIAILGISPDVYYNFEIPSHWLARSIEEVELIVDRHYGQEPIEKCQYLGPYSIVRVQTYIVITIWVAKTGTLLANDTHFSEPRSCPDSYQFPGYGGVVTFSSYISFDYVKIWIEPYVMGTRTATY